MDKMPPGERAKHHEEMRRKWEGMTPEQRAARRREMPEHFEKMSPEGRRQFREDMQGMPGMMPADRPEKAPGK